MIKRISTITCAIHSLGAEALKNAAYSYDLPTIHILLMSTNKPMMYW